MLKIYHYERSEYLKRIVCLLLAVSLMLVTSSTALAIEEGAIRPNYVGLSSVTPSVTVNTNSTVLCSGKVVCKADYTASVIWSLQYQSNRSWIPVQSWNGSGKTILLNQIAATVSGRIYRLQAVVKVYNSSGKQVETVTGTSNSIKT